jgi:hypothetical protein
MNVFSFCLYGDKDKYCLGLIENIKIIQEYFPTWKIFVYHANDVPNEIMEKIKEYKNILVRPTRVDGPINMIHRFYAIDEPAVETMIVRDADSRINARDRWTINQWLNSGKGAHIIRDHPYHNAYIMGGMWGIHKYLLKTTINSLFEKYRNQHKNLHGEDQFFLQRVIYPLISKDALYHCCIQKTLNEIITPIPFPVVNGEFIGQVVEYDNMRNPIPNHIY